MKPCCQMLIIGFFVIYMFLSVITVFKLFFSSIEDNGREWYMPYDASQNGGNQMNSLLSVTKQVKYEVEIWGKAAIAKYLWQHILGGTVVDSQSGLIQTGSIFIDNTNFTYRSGPGFIQTTVPKQVKNIVLVLNGRSEEKISVSKLWLDYIPLFESVTHVAVVLLGDEGCNNNWLLPYMKSRGGTVDVVFLVYDSPLIDNEEFYQWPLGVAVYRGFPDVKPEELDLLSSRSLHCNFLGTIYENSSRQILSDIIKSSPYQDVCYIKGRKVWQPLETPETLKLYMASILKSDLTLSPVGKNTECYRIYEAMSLGSIPVVEDVVTPGNCDSSLNGPLRLLKENDAPIIYLKSWHQLSNLLQQESLLTLEEKVDRRVQVTEWYRNFKRNMGNLFMQVIKRKFFNINE